MMLMEILNYTDFKDSIRGMVSKNDKIFETEDFWLIKRNVAKVILLPKNSKNKITIEDIKKYDETHKLSNHQRVCLQYIPESIFLNSLKNDLKNNKIEATGKFSLNSLISFIEPNFFDLKGKNYKEIRETKNQLKKEEKVYYKDNIDKPLIANTITNFINNWNNTNGMKYRRTNHSGYDKNFFLNYYPNHIEDFYSLFFYSKKTNELLGYSIVSKKHEMINDLPCYSYLIRKCTQDTNSEHIRNLTLYIDYCTFENIKQKSENKKGFYIHWGASKGNLLKYKKKFPIYSESKIRFLTINTKDLFKNE